MATLRNCLLTGCILLVNTLVARAQQPSRAVSGTPDCAKAAATIDHATMDHAAHLASLRNCEGPAPTSAGQAAFGAIGEVVRMLQADSTTDWSKVNVEALRQHLIDMDYVTLRSEVVQRAVPGGIQMDVTGTGRTLLAIRRMAVSHTMMLDEGGDYRAAAKEIPGGARLTIAAKNPADAQLVARIRGLGFAGLMTEGDHHARHHLALARGASSPHAR